MSNPIDHHYVPRSFFRPWENKERKVLVYERKNGVLIPPFWQSTKVICVYKGLYSYSDSIEEQKRNLIETNLLSQIDNDAAKVLQKLYNTNGLVNLESIERSNFSAFINSLRIRTPESILYNTKYAKELLRDELLKEDPRVNDPEIQKILAGRTLLEWAEDTNLGVLENYGHKLMADYIIDEKFVKPIFDTHWIVKSNLRKSEVSFLSSDRPLILLSSIKKPSFGFALAISPNSVLIINRNPAVIEKMLNMSFEKLAMNVNISTIQQAKAKAFAFDNTHSTRFFERRLGGLHKSILPWANFIVE